MASSKTISIGFKIENAAQGGFKNLTMNAEGFSKAMNISLVESEKLKGSLINFGNVRGYVRAKENADMTTAYAVYDTQVYKVDGTTITAI